MFVKKNLGAAILDRATACATYPPGSDAWRRFNCGPAPAPSTSTPAPSQATLPEPVPSQLPGTYIRPPPPPPPQTVIVTVDNEAGKRADAEYNARLRAQMSETEALRAKAASDAAADQARREAEILRAQSNRGLVDWDGGAAAYSNAGGSNRKSDSPESSKDITLWVLGFAALIGYAVSRKKK